MRITFKLSVLALVIMVAMAVVPVASATSVEVLDITLSGTQIGTATLTQGGIGGCGAAATDVCVSIVMSGSNQVRIGGPTIGFSGNISGSSTITNSSLSLPSFGVGACGNLGTTLCFHTTGPGTGSTWTLVLTNADVNTGIQMGLHVVSSLCVGGNTCFATLTPGTPPPTVPEPGTLGLLGTGLVGIAGLVRRKFRS